MYKRQAYELQKIVPSDKSLKSFVAKDPAASAQMQSVEKASIKQPLSNSELFMILYGFGRLEYSIYTKTLDKNNVYDILDDMQRTITNRINDKLGYESDNQ